MFFVSLKSISPLVARRVGSVLILNNTLSWIQSVEGGDLIPAFLLRCHFKCFILLFQVD